MDERTTDGRARHANHRRGDFGRVVAWTIVGALLPGSGLVAAGLPVAGWTVIAVWVTGLAVAIGTLLSSGDVIQAVADRAVDPGFLLQAAVAALLACVLLAAVVLWTHAALRRQAVLSGPQRRVSAVLVVALLVAVCAPLGRAASYAMIQHDLLTSVFDNPSQPKPATSALPRTGAADPWAGVQRLNVLLIGSDAGADRQGLRPDSMIIASIVPRTGDTVLVGIPRNLVRAPFPAGSQGAAAWPDGFGPLNTTGLPACGKDYQDCQINAVWRTADETARRYFPGESNVGLAATRQVVQGVTGLHVDYVAMLDLRGFSDFVTAIGGVTVNVHRRLPIGGNMEHRVATGGWIEPGGNQHLDGYHALWFARSRWLYDDYDRMRRQRCVVAAAVQQTDPVKLARGFPALAASIKSSFLTDIPLAQLPAWVQLAMRVKKAKVHSLAVTKETYGGQYAHPDYPLLRRAVHDSLVPPVTPRPTAEKASGSVRKTTPAKPRSPADDVQQVC